MTVPKEVIDIVIILLALLFFLLQGLLVYRMIRTRQKGAEKLEELLTESEEVLDAKDLWTGEHEGVGTHDGHVYSYRYTPGSRYEPPSFVVSMDAVSSGAFEVRRETAVDRFFKNIGIVSEIQTGDLQFDSDFYIQTDTVAFTMAFLMDTRKRYAIYDILNAGYSSVRHDEKVMQAVWSPFTLDEPVDDDLLARTAERLARLDTRNRRGD